MRVKDAMTTDPQAVGPHTSLKDTAAILAEHRMAEAPVVDEEGHVIGVITAADILIKERAEVQHRRLGSLLHHREATELATKVEARTAGEAMSAPPATIEPWEPLADAATLMLERGINCLPVVEGDKLVGFLTRADFVRAFARTDGEIEREIRDDALIGLAVPEALEVRVEKGDVTLRGEVDTKYDAQAIPATIRRIPGVVSIDAELDCWDPDANCKVVVATRL
jgi:CBS domain-containing protein